MHAKSNASRSLFDVGEHIVLVVSLCRLREIIGSFATSGIYSPPPYPRPSPPVHPTLQNQVALGDEGLQPSSSGDFNEILHVEDHKGVTSLPASAEEFKSWMHDMQLLDLPFTDRKFTWFRGRSCSRIDRILVSVEWVEEFSYIRLKGGSRDLSDHYPLIVEDIKGREGPRPFRSLDSWFTHDGFLRMVKYEWRSLGDIQFTRKLKALMVPLRKWHTENFSDMDNKIMRFEDEIKKIDNLVGDGNYDGTTEARRRALVKYCEKWYVRKEIHWKQMSRSKLARNMDKNTRYFHQVASTRRRNNRIDALMIHGRLVRNQIERQEAEALEVLPSVEEIRDAVWIQYEFHQEMLRGNWSRVHCSGDGLLPKY
ncbi:uncharacterized protein LOC107615423 [Arachis ipaensis]|uniref:uncharacterized protein LOC107615423 n=1 Tax=Arachis ipaensis TaxID=130454 RepID=UPI0007AF7905|nr:uncharacterized protein LOC107615423 [Arachis ipaensis]XP_025678394.1 uncharacterized protein LOC112778273 [Arachis hypogaea]